MRQRHIAVHYPILLVDQEDQGMITGSTPVNIDRTNAIAPIANMACSRATHSGTGPADRHDGPGEHSHVVGGVEQLDQHAGWQAHTDLLAQRALGEQLLGRALNIIP